MTELKEMATSEIKAMLYDLQVHNCNGRMTFRADGKPDPDDKPCDYCLEVSMLLRELRLRLLRARGE